MTRASSPPRILITGGTGFLGKHVVAKLRAQGGPNAVIDIISRNAAVGLRGDLTQWDGGMDLAALRDRYDVLIHLAGLYDLRATPVEALRQNVNATHTALVIAQKARIAHFVHASTIAVTVGERGTASEKDLKRVGLDPLDPLIFPDILDTSRAFPDHYSRTKAYAEHLVKQWPTGNFESKLNLRLGVLVGDSQTGRIERIDGPYHAIDFLRRNRELISKYSGKIPLPGNQGRSVPIVPVDITAGAIAKLVVIGRERGWSGYRSLHLVPSQGLDPDTFYTSALRNLEFPNPGYRLVHRIPKTVLKRVGEWISRIPREELEYLLSFPRLDVSETEAVLGADWCPGFKDYEASLWKGYREYVSHR